MKTDILVINAVPELPDDYYKWAYEILDEETDVTIGYKRKGNKVTYYCMECGLVYEEKIHKGKFDGFIPYRNYLPYKCKKCGKEGTLENEGYLKGYDNIVYTAIAQRNENGLYLREFMHRKSCLTEGVPKYESREIYRMGIFGNTVIKKIAEYRWRGEYGWEFDLERKNNINNSNNFYNAYTYYGFYDVVKEHFPYLDIYAYLNLLNKASMQGEINYPIVDIIETYARYPGIEMLLKLGYPEIVKSIIYKLGKTNLINKRKTRIHEVLRIRPDLLPRYNASHKYLETLQYMSKNGIKGLSDSDIQLLDKMICRYKNRFKIITKYMSLIKALNRIEKYEGEKVESRYGGAYELRTHEVVTKYSDYLEMRSELGYDMTNTVFLFPKRLSDAHQEMVEEKSRRDDELYIGKMNKKYSAIKNKQQKLKKAYEMSLNGFLFSVPKDAEDIIMEGRVLHHCVGREMYLQKHATGKSTIVFMRTAEHPKERFITIEIDKTEILQWYGINDTKPNDEKVYQTIAEYERICCKKKVKAAV